MRRALIGLFTLLAGAGVTWAENWPGFRGPRGDGRSAEQGLPFTWSATENVRWQIELPGPGNSSPVVWGKRIFLTQSLSFGSAGLFCYDMDGNEQWHHDLGKLYHIWGNASSPILYANLVILLCGPGERQFLRALDKKSGQPRWKHDEPGVKADGFSGSWSTPVVAKERVNATLAIADGELFIRSYRHLGCIGKR